MVDVDLIAVLKRDTAGVHGDIDFCQLAFSAASVDTHGKCGRKITSPRHARPFLRRKPEQNSGYFAIFLQELTFGRINKHCCAYYCGNDAHITNKQRNKRASKQRKQSNKLANKQTNKTKMSIKPISESNKQKHWKHNKTTFHAEVTFEVEIVFGLFSSLTQLAACI